MCPTDQIELIFPQKQKDDLLPENITDSPFWLSPQFGRRVGVGPQQVAHEPLIWDVCRPFDEVDLVEISQFWGQSSMHAQYFIFDDSSYGHAVEAIDDSLPDFHIVAGFA